MQGDAGHARPALPHAHTQLADSKPGTVQQQNNLGFWIVIGVPVGKSADDPAVGDAEAAGAIGDFDPAEHVYEFVEQMNADHSTEGLLVASGA